MINVAREPEVLAALAADKGYFDALFEASGAEAALRSGIEVVRPRGVIVQLGLGGDMTIPINLITAKELELRGTFRFHEESALALEFIGKGLIDVKGFVTFAHFTCQHRCALKDRTKENQSLGALDVGAKSTGNGLFLASVTMPPSALVSTRPDVGALIGHRRPGLAFVAVRAPAELEIEAGWAHRAERDVNAQLLRRHVRVA